MGSKILLGEIANLHYGKMPDKKLLGTGAFRAFSGYQYIDCYPEYNTPANTLVVVARGVGGTGDVKYVEDRVFLTNLSIAVEIPDVLVSRYLFWRYKQSGFNWLRSGSAQPQITISDLGRIEVDLPSRDVMASSVSFFDSLDKNIRLNNQLNDYLAELLDALFAKALEGADDWEEATLLDLASYKNGLAMQKFRPEVDDPGLPVLKIKELGQGSCGPDAERCRSDIDESVRIYDGDLVFSWSGTLLLDFWAGGDAGLNQHLFKVTSGKYPSWFVYMWTKYHMRRFIALAKDRATTMGHIKRSALAEAEVLIPSVDVLNKLTDQMQPVVDQIIGLKVEARKLGELRDALLPKLMSGEIDVSKVDLAQSN